MAAPETERRDLVSAALLGTVVALFLMLATAAKAEDREKPRAPAPVPAYPLIGVPANLPIEAANAACAFAQSQPEGRRLMLFNFGQAHFQAGEFGAGRRPFYSNDQILDALIAAADRYRNPDCHQPRTRATIAYGVTNFRLSETGTTVSEDFAPMSPQVAREAGAAQLEVVQRLERSVSAKDETAPAGDIEPGWDLGPAGVTAAKALVSGANIGELPYVNFGTAGHCPPYPGANPGCGSWGWDELGVVSQSRGAVALPQMYHAFQAEQWNTVRERWNRRKVDRPKRCAGDDPPAKCFAFAGATAELEECGSDFSARQSWKRLRDAVPDGAIGEELVFYNPARLNCEARAPSGQTRSRSSGPAEPSYRLLPRVEPARIVADPDPVVPSEILYPIVNGWRAGDRHGITLVEAGLAGDDPTRTTGRFVILREREQPFAQSVDVVDVPGSGRLRITAVPTGKRAARSARLSAGLEFTTERGVTGTFDLRDRRVTLD